MPRISSRDFRIIDKGFHRDLLLSDKIYEYEVNDSPKDILKDVSLMIRSDLINDGICEDVVLIGSATYKNMNPKSDLDFLGIKRGSKNRRYYFKVKILDKIWPAEMTIDNGVDKPYLRFRYREDVKKPEDFIVSSPKCWSFLFLGVFDNNNLMHKLAQIDAFEMTGTLLCVLLNDHKGGSFYITPDEFADRLKEELLLTTRKPLFMNNRWERGLRSNCMKLVKGVLDHSPFWAERQENGSYLIKPQNGIVRRKHLYSISGQARRFFTPSYFGYLVDKNRYKKLPRFVNPQ